MSLIEVGLNFPLTKLPLIEMAQGLWDASLQVGYVWADEPRATAAAIMTGTNRATMKSAALSLATLPLPSAPCLISSYLHPNCLTSSFPQIIDEVAAQYGLAALMQEKPFAVSHSTRIHTPTSASHHLRLADCIALTCSHTLLSSLGGKRIRQAQQLVPLHQRGRQSAKCRTARQEVRQHRDLPSHHGRLSEGCR